jgi:hypothetical protein
MAQAPMKKPAPAKSKVIKGSAKNSGAGYSEDDGGSAPAMKKPMDKKAPAKKGMGKKGC